MFFSPFLAVQASFWPFLRSFILFSVTSNLVFYFNSKISFLTVFFSILVLLAVMYLWWQDVNSESLIGYHTHKLEVSLRVGMLFFILSEVFFFISFFWGFWCAKSWLLMSVVLNIIGCLVCLFRFDIFLTLIFLLFDLEVVMLLFIVYLIFSSSFYYGLLVCLVFCWILQLGLFYEWSDGTLDWVS